MSTDGTKDSPETNPNKQLAEAILPLVGGAANVTSVTHCMTRMRLGLADRSLVRDEPLKALPDVMGVVEDDTYQIVLGPGKVARVTPEFEALVRSAPAPASASASASEATGAAAAESASASGPAPSGHPGTRTAEDLAAEGAAIRAARKEKNATPVKLILRRIANIFVPLIPALIGCGIVAGINGLLANAGWLPSLTPALAAIASGFMSLIAVFVGLNTAREFGGTPVLGGAAAAVIVFPGVADVSAFGQKLAPGQGGVLGALFAALLAVYVEKACRRLVPSAVDVLVTPTVTVLIAGLVTLFGLMYVCGEIATGIGHVADWLLQHGGAAAGFVLGGLFLPLVMLGLHQALIPIHTTLIEQSGYTVLLPILAMAGAGQVGAAVAIYLRLRRNTSIRKTIRSALPAGFLGVGEPLIYGVSLPLGRPFITACVGGAFGGGIVGLFYQLGTSVGSTAIGPSGWALFPLLKGNHGLGAIAAIYGLGLAAGYLVGFGATYFFGFSKQMLSELNAPSEAEAEAETPDPEGGPSAEGPSAEGPQPGSPNPSPAPAPTGGSGSLV
ncbi:PTS transporter subunit EIIC [Streptomyces sp. 891-h]|uniref:PTS transporter subunit EIIC n=1 Tax=Streptomyces sp. 891-h TaxID=2720714 RepID=UPI001FAA7E1A|nr:PTS transporter subunit EIIC [Streptomyces sp. 891-h]UNZ18682.1 PTS transporter subunit EIIC [Streptomyces sp. 891-h]